MITIDLIGSVALFIGRGPNGSSGVVPALSG